VLGYVTINTNGGATNLSGKVVWTKLAVPTNSYYPQGFSDSLDVLGAGMLSTTYPITDSAHTNNLTVTLADGDLATPINITGIWIDKSNQVRGYSTNSPGVGSPSNLRISPGHLLTGLFVNPTTGLTNTFQIGINQITSEGFGEFTSATNSGTAHLH